MKEKLKEWSFFAAVFAIVVAFLATLAPPSESVQTAPQIVVPIPELTATDLVMIAGVALAIPLSLLTMWALQFLPQPAPPVQVAETIAGERAIIVQGISPEAFSRVKRERDEWQEKCQVLQRTRPEPERELSYEAVEALLKAGNVGIKRGRDIVRENRGVVGRDYTRLQKILDLLPSPTAEGSPTTHKTQAAQAVNGEPGPVNAPVNRRAVGRSQPRNRRRRP